MDQENPKEEIENNKEAENAIEIHSLESDMKAMGIGTEEEESIEEEQPADAESQEEETQDPKPKKKSRAQRKIERQNRKIKELEDQLHKKESKPSEVKEEINVDDFENYDDYLKALDEQEEAPAQEEKKEETPTEDNRIAEMFEDGAEDFGEEFDKLVRADDLRLSEALLNEVLDAENPSAVAYYLATHKDLSAKISEMTPKQVLKEVAKIEIELEKEPVKVVKKSKAPEPINPISGQSAKAKSLGDDDLSFEEHEALLNNQQRKSAGGFI